MTPTSQDIMARLKRLEELVRDLGSAWRAGDDEAISNALAALEDEAGPREQSG